MYSNNLSEIVSLKDEFEGLKVPVKFARYRNLWEKAGNFQCLTDFPLHLDIELSGVCNLRCDFCSQDGLITEPLGMMKEGLFQKIINDGVENGLCAIKLQIRGESFLHPKLFDCIRYAKDAGVMDVQVTTNGTLLDEKCIHKVFDSGLDRIVFSVDAHHSENYKQRYSTQKYSSVEYNVKRFLELRTELGISRPWVRLQASIPQTDAFHVKQTRLYIEGKFPEADMVGVNRIYDFCDDIDSFPDLHKNYKMLPCSYLMQRLSVFWNGDVTTCCMDYNNHFKLGNVEYQTIQEIWLSEKMYQFRKTHFSGQRKTMSICKYCHNSTILLSDKNVLDNTPGHIAEYT